MSSDINFTVKSWFLGNVLIKPYLNTQLGRGTIILSDFGRSLNPILTRKGEANCAHKITICPLSYGPVLELEQKGGFWNLKRAWLAEFPSWEERESSCLAISNSTLSTNTTEHCVLFLFKYIFFGLQPSLSKVGKFVAKWHSKVFLDH